MACLIDMLRSYSVTSLASAERCAKSSTPIEVLRMTVSSGSRVLPNWTCSTNSTGEFGRMVAVVDTEGRVMREERRERHPARHEGDWMLIYGFMILRRV
jgi:hypothetical protein